MTPEQQLIDGAVRAWKFSTDRFEKSFRDLSDTQLEAQVAPGRNRLLYLLGHVAAVHDRMLPLLGIGPRRHAELDPFFIESPDSSAPSPITASALKEMLLEIDGALADAFNKWSPADWRSKHTAVSDEDFAKEPHRNRFSVLLSRNAHLQFHHGQVVLTEPRANG